MTVFQAIRLMIGFGTLLIAIIFGGLNIVLSQQKKK